MTTEYTPDLVLNYEVTADDYTDDDGRYVGPVDTHCQMEGECCSETPAPTFISTGDANEPSRWCNTFIALFDDGTAKSVCEDCIGWLEERPARYIAYKQACEAEECEAHSLYQWVIHNEPTGPLG